VRRRGERGAGEVGVGGEGVPSWLSSAGRPACFCSLRPHLPSGSLAKSSHAAARVIARTLVTPLRAGELLTPSPDGVCPGAVEASGV
jgi:hypothetical protein